MQLDNNNITMRRRRPRQTQQRVPLSNLLFTISLLLFSFLSMSPAAVQAQDVVDANSNTNTTDFAESLVNFVVETVQNASTSSSTDSGLEVSRPPVVYRQYNISRRYHLFFQLDGPTGSGSINYAIQVRIFMIFMKQLTNIFPLFGFASQDDVSQVITNCTYRGQSLYDEIPEELTVDTVQGRKHNNRNNAPTTYLFTARQATTPPPLDVTAQQDPLVDMVFQGNSTYEYIFDMNFSSDVINVQNYSEYFLIAINKDEVETALEKTLRIMLNVTNSVLTVLETLPPEELAEAILGPNGTLPPNVDSSNNFVTAATETVFPSWVPSMAPSISDAPSWAPTISPRPTVSSPPSAQPSNAPTAFPTFEQNSTSRGRFDMSFIVTSDDYDPSTTALNMSSLCAILLSTTPLIVTPPHQADQIDTDCFDVSGSWRNADRTRPPLTPLPTIPPQGSSNMTNTTPSVDFGTTNDDAFGNAIGTDDQVVVEDLQMENATSRNRMLLRRGRGLQGADAGDEVADPFEADPIAPSTVSANTSVTQVLWSYKFTMSYNSEVWNVREYPDLLEDFVNENKTYLEQAIKAGLGVWDDPDTLVEVREFRRVFPQTEAPSALPSAAPSEFPTFHTTHEPTIAPSSSASPTSFFDNSTNATFFPTFSNWTNDTFAPSMAPTNATPITPAPAGSEDDGLPNGTFVAIVVVVTLVAAGILLLGVLYILRRRMVGKKRRSTAKDGDVLEAANYPAPDKSQAVTTYQNKPSVDATIATGTSTSRSDDSNNNNTRQQVAPQHSESLLVKLNAMKEASSSDGSINTSVKSLVDLNKDPRVAFHTQKDDSKVRSSLLSDIEENAFSDDDDDDDLVLANNHVNGRAAPYQHKKTGKAKGRKDDESGDPFDQFNDKNLEKMRSSVENRVAGLDDMMSQAMTMALMSDVSPRKEEHRLIWHGASNGMEIEANALWEVTDWLRRNEISDDDERREYMQTLLNKMVTSVRVGMMAPEDASRTIHECAALLDLQLAHQLPVTTVVLTGMQKTTTSKDVVEAFRSFGPIDNAAVATDQRGFGLVRFKNQNAANKAIQKFRSSEIVVKDVAVTLRLLSPIYTRQSMYR